MNCSLEKIAGFGGGYRRIRLRTAKDCYRGRITRARDTARAAAPKVTPYTVALWSKREALFLLLFSLLVKTKEGKKKKS